MSFNKGNFLADRIEWIERNLRADSLPWSVQVSVLEVIPDSGVIQVDGRWTPPDQPYNSQESVENGLADYYSALKVVKNNVWRESHGSSE